MTEQELEDYITSGNHRMKIGNLEGRCLTMFYWKDEKGNNVPGVVLQFTDSEMNVEQDGKFLVVEDISKLEVPVENER